MGHALQNWCDLRKELSNERKMTTLTKDLDKWKEKARMCEPLKEAEMKQLCDMVSRVLRRAAHFHNPPPDCASSR